MNSDVAAAIIAGVTGVITGGVGSLAAPWSQWGVDQRRERRARRVRLVESWRRGSFRYFRTPSGPVMNQDWYHSLRLYLHEAVREGFEGNTTTITQSTGDVALRHGALSNQYPNPSALNDEIERIAKRWKID